MLLTQLAPVSTLTRIKENNSFESLDFAREPNKVGRCRTCRALTVHSPRTRFALRSATQVNDPQKNDHISIPCQRIHIMYTSIYADMAVTCPEQVE